MQSEPVRIRVSPDSEVAHLLENAKDGPLLLEKNGEVYRVVREENIWASYDPAQVRKGLHKSAGALQGVDLEKLIHNIHEARQQASDGRQS